MSSRTILRSATLQVGALAVVLALAGCSFAPAAVSPSPSASAAASGLLPEYATDFTVAAAQAETEKLAKRIVGQIARTSVLHDDIHSVDVPAAKTAGHYGGVLHTLTLEPNLAPVDQAQAVVVALESAGWLVGGISNTGTSYTAPLISDANRNKAWIVAIGADSSVAGQSVVTIQLASPNIP